MAEAVSSSSSSSDAAAAAPPLVLKSQDSISEPPTPVSATPVTPGSAPADGPRPVFSLHVLPFVTELQQQNGLRHEDYQRYRQYCSRRLCRIHKILHFSHGARKFVKKVVTAPIVREERFLHIPLLLAERAWSYYMQLKHLVDENTHGSRKLFHSRSRLRKAVAHAEVLHNLAATPGLCDPRTELETSAYAAWLAGSLAFEMERWDEAIEKLQRARFIYERLSSLCDPTHRGLYTQRIDEIDANIKFSAFSKSGSAGLEDLLKMQQAARVGALADELASKIDLAVAHTRQAQSGAVAEVVWHGQSLPIRSDKAREHLQRARTKEFDIDQQTRDGVSDLSGLYDELFMAYGDATRAIADDMPRPSGKEKKLNQKEEVLAAQLSALMGYISFLKLSRLIERTKHMLAQPGLKANEKVHLYDTILQNIAEIADIPQQRDDLASCQWAAAQTLLYKALRAYSIAECERERNKIAEALALYDRAVGHAVAARAQLMECEGDTAAPSQQIEELLTTIRGTKCVLKAGQAVAKVETKTFDPARPVLDQTGVYSEDLALLRTLRLVDFPPDFQAVACKPLFFDLASNHVQYPSLADRTSSMLGGLLKGLWGGKK